MGAERTARVSKRKDRFPSLQPPLTSLVGSAKSADENHCLGPLDRVPPRFVLRCAAHQATRGKIWRRPFAHYLHQSAGKGLTVLLDSLRKGPSDIVVNAVPAARDQAETCGRQRTTQSLADLVDFAWTRRQSTRAGNENPFRRGRVLPSTQTINERGLFAGYPPDKACDLFIGNNRRADRPRCGLPRIRLRLTHPGNPAKGRESRAAAAHAHG